MGASLSFAVIGAGNAGQTITAELVRQGFTDTALVDSNPTVIKSIADRGGIAVLGSIREYFAPVERLGISLEEAVKSSKVLILATNAIGYGRALQSLAPLVTDDHLIVAITGYYASFVFRKVLRDLKLQDRASLVEMMTLPYASRLVGPAQVGLRAVTKRLPTATWPSIRDSESIETLKTAFPMLVPATNALEVSLNNPNPVFHVPVALLNLGRFESEEVKKGFFYAQWASPGIERIWRIVDEERIRVMKGFGLNPISKDEYRAVCYGGEPMKPVAVRGEIPPSSYSLPPRFFDEDVPFGLCPISAFGRIAGIPTPTVDTLIDLVSTIKDQDYRGSGLNPDTLGIAGLSSTDVVRVAMGEI